MRCATALPRAPDDAELPVCKSRRTGTARASSLPPNPHARANAGTTCLCRFPGSCVVDSAEGFAGVGRRDTATAVEVATARRRAALESAESTSGENPFSAASGVRGASRATVQSIFSL